MYWNNRINIPARWTIAVLTVLFALYASFVFPFFLKSKTVEFNTSNGNARERDKILGLVYRTSPEQVTAISGLVTNPARTRTESTWVIVSQCGFLFPYDIIREKYAMDRKYRRVLQEIDNMECSWNLCAIDNTSRIEQACTYLNLVGQGKVNDATDFVASLCAGSRKVTGP